MAPAPAPAPAAPPAKVGCPPDWGAFDACASGAYWTQTVPFVGPMLTNCLTNPSSGHGAFGDQPSPFDAVAQAQFDLAQLNQQWAQAVGQIDGIDLQNMQSIFTQLADATGGLQTSIDVAFTPARHLIAYLTVTIFFLGVLVSAAAWAI